MRLSDILTVRGRDSRPKESILDLGSARQGRQRKSYRGNTKLRRESEIQLGSRVPDPKFNM